MADWVMDLLRTGGYPALAALAAIECLFPPLPSELIFPLAGYLTHQGQLSAPGCVVAGALGNVAGSGALYGLGRRLGGDRVEQFVQRHCRWAGVSVDEVRRAREWFDRRGPYAVLLAHLIPGVRSLIALPAGAQRMPLPRFVVLTLIGAGVWSGVLVMLGVALGSGFEAVETWLNPVSWLVIGASVGWYLYRVFGSRRNGADCAPA